MIWLNHTPTAEKEEKELPEIAAGSQYDMAAEQVRLLAERQRAATSAYSKSSLFTTLR